MTDTAKVIFSVIGTGVAVLTISLTVTLFLADGLRADIREMRGLLIMHIASAHHVHAPDANTIAAAPPPELPQ